MIWMLHSAPVSGVQRGRRPVKSSHGGSRCWLRLYAEFSEAGGWQPQWTHGSRTALALGGFDIQLMDDLD
jgi:hypothetical protein